MGESEQQERDRNAVEEIPRSPKGATWDKRQKIQRQLDEALADSFPASDPVSIVTSNEEEDWGEPREPSAPGSSQPGSRS